MTLSTAHRPEKTPLAAMPEFLRLRKALLWRLQQSDYGLTSVEGLALLQHYGWPTEIFDFTSSLRVALAFAGSKPVNIARICVIPYEQSLGGHILDLSGHPWAARAQRQSAFGLVAPPNLLDLKSGEARIRLGVQWYEFPVTHQEFSFLEPEYQGLLNPSTDPSAAFLRHHVNEFVEANGPFSPTFTQWLIGTIPMAARCLLVKAFEESEVVINHRGHEHLPRFMEGIERECSRRYWSGEAQSSARIRNWKWPAVGNMVIDPRTYHPEEYSSA